MKSSLIKRISIILGVLVVLLISALSYYLYTINDAYKDTFNETKKAVMKETDMTQIQGKYVFQEKNLYHIFTGEDQSNQTMIASIKIPEDEKEITPQEIKTYDSRRFVTEKAMIKQWEETCNQCKFIKIQPAIIDSEILWEITYHDNDNRYVFDYYAMSDGSAFETFKLKRNFN